MNGGVRISGTVEVPGDKSISHRAVMLSAIADGESRIEGFLHAEDTLSTIGMMRALGARIVEETPTDLRVEGVGFRGLSEAADVIDAGNSGTTLRIGSGILAAQPFMTVVTGDRYLRRRPMKRIVEPLRRMGAAITGRCGDTLPPLCIRGGSLKGIRHEMPVASAQVKSAVLLAGLYADGPTTVVEPLPSRDHTERMIEAMGVNLVREGRSLTVHPVGRLLPISVIVPRDISSAAFFIVLAASVPGAELRLPGIGVNPLRTGLITVLRRMGAEIQMESMREEGGEPVADLVVYGMPLTGTEIAPEEVPSLVDEAPALCVAAALAEGRTAVRGAEELRVKESDRIGSMVTALASLGVRCGEFPDGLWIDGPAAVSPGVRCDSRGDHRIAMSLSILSAATGVPVEVTDTACIDTSFPGFRGLLNGVLGPG
ncbi:MAG: 3-phosphoshikimate 1-carboxyvinyltransferase [Deltaproteobacteria bacterium]|nr:3-phosphoshikimate 1-carboxyvinyltransferase [Deltaproteobacteria bacterium]